MNSVKLLIKGLLKIGFLAKTSYWIQKKTPESVLNLTATILIRDRTFIGDQQF